jgi:Fe-S-cluster containining protein
MAKQCIQCGNCCKWAFFPTSLSYETEAGKEWLDVRGVKNQNGVLRVNIPCPKLSDDGKCSINDCKPQSCKEWEPGSDPICPLYTAPTKEKSMEITRKDGKIMEVKQFAVEDFKAGTDENGNTFITGYANTKNSEDRYGDIPTVFAALRSYVYELEDFHKNPVCLLNHENSTDNIAGSFNPNTGGYIAEDERGLKFKMVFSNSDFPPVAHARTVYQEGHGRALSIGGSWFHEDKDNPNHLTLAEIYEVSLVGVGADQNAVTVKSLTDAEKGEAENQQVEPDESTTAPQVPSVSDVIFESTDEALKMVCDEINREGEK